MARTPIVLNSSLYGSGVLSLDTTNGNTFVGLGALGALQDKLPLHWIYVTTGSGNIVVKAGYSPWAPSMAAGDLTIAVSGTNTVTDIGPQIQLARHLKAASGDLYIDVDYTGGITGTVLVAFANLQLIPANTAQVGVVKGSPGQLVAAIVTTLGTAAWNAYDDAMAGVGNAIATFAGSAAQGSMVAPNRACQKGITSVSVASGPAVSVLYV